MVSLDDLLSAAGSHCGHEIARFEKIRQRALDHADYERAEQVGSFIDHYWELRSVIRSVQESENTLLEFMKRFKPVR